MRILRQNVLLIFAIFEVVYMMSSWYTAVYRYHGISVAVYYRWAFLDTAHP